MTEWMKCTKTGECKLTDCPHFKNPHRKVDEINHCRADGCNSSCHGTVCVPYRLRVGDRVRTPLGDVGEINELTYNNESAKVYDKSGRLVVHCSLIDLEYLPPEVEENQKAFGDREAYKNFYSHNQAFLLKFNPDGTARIIAPTYRWTGKPLTPGNLWRHGEISSDCFTSQFIELCRHFDIYNFAFSLDDKKLLDWAIKVPVRIKWLIEKGFYEEVKPEWLLG